MLTSLLFSIIVKGQNGGSAAESSSLKLESAGAYSYRAVVRAINKQNCTVDVKFEHNGQTTIKSIPAFSSDTIQVTLPDCVIKAKPMTNCSGNNDMGWVEINMCAALPIKFERIMAKYVNPTTTEITFTVGSAFGSKTATFNLRMKSGTVKKYTVQMPYNVKAGETWKVTIDRTKGTYTTIKL